MTRIYILIIAIAFSVNVYAQSTSVAVLDFEAVGAAITQGEANVVTAMFATYLSEEPQLTVVDRKRVEDFIAKQGWQHSEFTNSDVLAKIGSTFNVAYIVTGDISILGEQCTINCRVVDVKTGYIVASESDNWRKNTPYRDVMKRFAQTIAAKIHNSDGTAIPVPATAKATAVATVSATATVVIVNGVRWSKYNVDEKGSFVSEVHHVGKLYNWNEAKTVCPDGWRLPTKIEINGLLQLPNEWTVVNGAKGREFGSAPNTLFFPAAGYRYVSDGIIYRADTYGNYWSSTEHGGNYAAYLNFSLTAVGVNNFYRADGRSVRCVEK